MASGRTPSPDASVVAEPRAVTPEEREQREEYRLSFTDPPSPEDLVAGGLLSADVLRQVTAALDAARLDRRTRLLLSDPKIYGGILEQCADLPEGTRTVPTVHGFVLGHIGASTRAGAPAPTATARPPRRVVAATSSSGGTSPATRASTQSSSTATGNYVTRPVVRDMPCQVRDLDLTVVDRGLVAPVIDPTAIGTAQSLAYVMAVGEGMGVFATRDALVREWANGRRLQFTGNEVNDYLYCSLRRDGDMTPEQRKVVTAAVLGIPATGLPEGSTVNTEFPQAFGRLLAALLRFQKEQCECEQNAAVSRTAVNLLAQQVRWNLQNVVTGVTRLQARELGDRLENDIALLSDPEVVGQVACNDPDGFLGVLRALSDGTHGGTMNVVALQQAAFARNDIFAWLTFEPGIDDDAERAAFELAVEAALTLEATDSWLSGRPPRHQALSALTDAARVG